MLAAVPPALVAGEAFHKDETSALEEYRVVHGWPVLPEGRVLGAVSGVDVDSHGNVLVFHRNQRTWPRSDVLSTDRIASPTVTIFDGSTGRVLTEWGAGLFAMPHGLTVDDEDNVWLTDVALQQVFKFSHEGKLLLTLGEEGVAGDDAAHFNRPTDVAISADGSFFVSDGYRNTRVLKFSPAGLFEFQWGTPGSAPGEFDLPHGLALSGGRIYVADRSNLRVQVFDERGQYVAAWQGPGIGRPYGVAIAADGAAFVADGGDQPDDPPDRSGVVVLRPDGSQAARFGRWGNYDGQFEMAHDVAVAQDGAVYVGDIVGGRVQKFVRVRP
ncbi:MAG: peptidyl-alpha-hydroxyglycine alpha-amidating lyase family protein [Planctomycetes bacterium]|nr:peptidyl-alpha-hydroxyglycine alpha-amidating lyase family protein [Planctomycetota bacterium]